MSCTRFFFAGGGTGGHIYPAIAVAEKLAELHPRAKVHFFVSSRDIDSQILSKTGFEYTALPAVGFSARADRLLAFAGCFLKSYRTARAVIAADEKAVVVGVGGFVAAPVCFAGHRLGVPVVLINVDIVPGKANRIIARWAKEIFVQFSETAEYFGKRKSKVNVVGCPLRPAFSNPRPQQAIEKLGLDEHKKILLITGASSGSASINRTICSLLSELAAFADQWQIVHLTGRAQFEAVKADYAGAAIDVKLLDYFDDMADLLAAAELVIGRSGAVSVAEYAAAGCPAICMPYPHHKDMHQYLNAGKLVEAGAAIIVDDVPDEKERREWLWEELAALLCDDGKRAEMKKAYEKIANKDTASNIAGRLIEIAGQSQ